MYSPDSIDRLKSLWVSLTIIRLICGVWAALLQNYFALDKSLRELVNNVIMFKLNKTQTEKVFNECVESAKDKFEEIRNLVYDEPYQWMLINLPSQRIFKQWDEIIYNDDENKINI